MASSTLHRYSLPSWRRRSSVIHEEEEEMAGDDPQTRAKVTSRPAVHSFSCCFLCAYGNAPFPSRVNVSFFSSLPSSTRSLQTNTPSSPWQTVEATSSVAPQRAMDGRALW